MMISRKNKRLQELFKEYSDILFHVNMDGSIVFWGIQYLSSIPYRSPKVRVIMKTQYALPPQVTSSFLSSSLSIWYNSQTDSSIYFPTKLNILTSCATKNGSILSVFSFNVDDFFASNEGEDFARLLLVKSWCGHQAPIKSIYHKKSSWKIDGKLNELVATLDDNGELLIWKTDNQSEQFTQYYANFRIGDGFVHWLPIGDLLVVCDCKSLKIWYVHGDLTLRASTGANTVCALETYHNEPFVYLNSYITGNFNSESTDFDLIVNLVGVTLKNTVYLWEIKFLDKKYISNMLISISTLPVDGEILHFASTDDFARLILPSLLHLKPNDLSMFGDSHCFLTVDDKSSVCFWSWINAKWISDVSFSLDTTHEIVILKTDNAGKLLVVSRENTVSFNLSIWGNSGDGLEMAKEYTVKSDDSIVDADWFMTSDGQHLLVYATAGKIAVLCEQRVASSGDPASWLCISEFSFPINDQISGVAWLLDGNMIVSFGSSLRVYEKWMRKYCESISKLI